MLGRNGIFDFALVACQRPLLGEIKDFVFVDRTALSVLTNNKALDDEVARRTLLSAKWLSI